MNPDVPGIDIRQLSAAQWDGRACVSCGERGGPFVPITLIVGVAGTVIHYPGQCTKPEPAQESPAA